MKLDLNTSDMLEPGIVREAVVMRYLTTLRQFSDTTDNEQHALWMKADAFLSECLNIIRPALYSAARDM